MKPGYKQTEVGVIPEDWEAKPLRSVLLKGRLGGNYPNQPRQTEFPLMKMGNLGRGSMDVTKVEYITTGVIPEDQHRLKNGDVLFNTRNTLDLVGKVAIWRNELPIAYYNSNLMRLEFDPQQVCSNAYASAALNTSSAIATLRGLATGTTSVAAIYTRDLMEMPFVRPPLAEQEAIAGALSDADALIDSLEQLTAKKRLLKQGVMQDLLTGKKRLPGFEGEWEVKRLDEMAQFEAGQYLPKDKYCSGPFMVEGAGSPMGTNDTGTHKAPITVIGRVGTVGRPRFRSNGAWVNNNAAAIVAKRGIADPFFLHSILETVDWGNVVSTTAQPFLEVRQLLASSFAVPSLVPEQTAIAAILSDMDAEIAALEAKLAKARQVKQGMMQELLTGKTRLV